MSITKWLSSLWHWVRNKEVLLPINHDNTTTSHEILCRPDSETFQDKVPYGPRRSPSCDDKVQYGRYFVLLYIDILYAF